MSLLPKLRTKPLRKILERHSHLNELRMYQWTGSMYTYLSKTPLQAKAKLYITKLQHATTKTGLNGIIEEGFKGFSSQDSKGSHFFYCTGVPDSDDVDLKIRQWLSQYPEIEQTEENIKSFQNSPAFSDNSRYGNYKFTFELDDIIKAYRDQICGGKDPVFRIYGTFCYKKEIVYMVVVHSPDSIAFDHFPYLPTDVGDRICGKDDGGIYWCPEAMSDKCLYEQVEGTAIIPYPFNEYFVWDHMVFAFNMSSNMKFKLEYLYEHLTACDLEEINLAGERETKQEAEQYIKRLKASKLDKT
ncbi:uncharacterized protein LOC120539513 [Polypterus senegalus]|uniref:uncharacterized protein LOC120539513 n=1 Tax=Polypterus senegalus TaxID=55291 RepID=UPI00196697C0|nr:uncharacterized protein LOC120539513 [Polypterus senegalus]XP_039625573.1 uncharacterized protein LOC120539513 [Polypterus senegalus]XP_039625574.1 uncharacterized protein LOC120539513 [Polypterus senegalus]XP_039625575.1 uncharacterized protein LOC120539513 [Polypterus senegalus]XP_039625576.1 uncharacterized protein LOC120539513 [Polypterus senegalus]XP_039625577.1 uncharacterized protein LOC120539513 [Polypterus senegalus]XP_039625578.1 uncharacterized protein LOC120539513 [Polypterus s